MTPYNTGSVVLVRFPFTRLSASKKRPAIVISPAVYSQRHGDVAVLGLTSTPQPEPFLALRHWQAAGLLGPTWLKPVIFCLDQAIIDHQIGILATDDAARIPDALRLLMADDYRP